MLPAKIIPCPREIWGESVKIRRLWHDVAIFPAATGGQGQPSQVSQIGKLGITTRSIDQPSRFLKQARWNAGGRG
jgi:hypothetical protein